MSDLIDRQAAIDAMAELQGRASSKGELTGISKAWKRIKKLPPIQPETPCYLGSPCEYQNPDVVISQPEPSWIPVNERLPEDYADVLVWFEYFRYGDYNCLYQMHGIGSYSKEYNSWTINHETGWKDLHVFAWMPLPEPYKPNNK